MIKIPVGGRKMSIKNSLKPFVSLVLAAVLLTAGGYAIYLQFFHKQEVFVAAVGSRAPDFTLKNLKGEDQSLSDSKGEGVILTFWATYCPPCEKEMPLLEKAFQKYKGKGIEILAVNTAEPTVLVNQFISQKGLSFSILLDRDETVVHQYRVQNLPITFFINSEGEIVNKVSGELTKEELEKQMKQMKP
jgi:peroxiredoxin